jgi:hypothetical protein
MPRSSHPSRRTLRRLVLRDTRTERVTQLMIKGLQKYQWYHQKLPLAVTQEMMEQALDPWFQRATLHIYKSLFELDVVG